MSTRFTPREVFLSLLLFANPESPYAHKRLRFVPPIKERKMTKPVAHLSGTPGYYSTDPHSWGTENRSVIAEAVTRTENPEPQRVRVEAPVVAVRAVLDLDAPAKTRRPGIAVPAMTPRIDTPAGHVDQMANVHSWDR